jgi:nitrate reductase gamma subunit
MNELYEFLTGPGAWVAFTVCIGGLIVRASALFGLSRERDKVFWNHADWKWALRSIYHWLLPLGSVSLRSQPVFGIAFYVFHVCVLATPLFLLAHNTLWYEAFRVSLPSFAESTTDVLTVVCIISALVLLFRRILRPEVRIMTSAWDYFLLILSILPFATGFLAYHQIGPYEPMLVLHILFAEVLLVVIPFSKLGHVLLFFFSRAAIGVEMGSRRGARTW